MVLPGRNDPCLCGSGKKFKKCCIDKYKSGNIIVDPQPLTIEEVRRRIEEDMAWANDQYRMQALHFVEHADSGHSAESILQAVELWREFSAAKQPTVKKFGAFSAALEYMTAQSSLVSLSQQELGERYDVSSATVSKRFNELMEFAGSTARTPSVAAPAYNLEEARELLSQASAARFPKDRIRLAHEALKRYPNLPEAYIIIGEETANPAHAKAYYKQGIEAGEKELGAAFFKKHTGFFWDKPETRPYMQVKYNYAELCWYTGDMAEARKHLEELLKLQPQDSLGARYLLSAVLLTTGALKEAEQLLGSYSERSAFFEYDRMVLAYKQQGFTAKLKMLYRNAQFANGYILDYLLGKKRVPAAIPEEYSPGDRNEAIAYVVSHALLWAQLKDLIQWMKEQ